MVQEFAYNLQGRMAQVTTTEGSSIKTVRYEYDSAGNRITAIVDDGSNVTRTEYLTDDHNPTGYSQVLQETTFDAGDNPTRKVVYAIGHDQVSQTVYARSGGSWGAGETAVFGTDGHGSVRVLYDLAAAVVTAAGVEQLFHFDAFGNLIGQAWTGSGAAQPITSYLYSGESFDFTIGQQYLRARWYDAHTGRFNRLDPFFGNTNDPQSFHKYAYVHGDPIQHIDPTGKFIGTLIPTLLQGNLRNGDSARAAQGLGSAYDLQREVKIYNKALSVLDYIEGVYDTITDVLDLLSIDAGDLQQLRNSILQQSSSALPSGLVGPTNDSCSEEYAERASSCLEICS